MAFPKHPLYQKFESVWQMLLDAYEGEQAVKDARTKYLPATPAQIVDGMGIDSCGHPKDGELPT
jgi:hypothetical protein